MAIPVGRTQLDIPGERLALYGARAAAFAAYVAAVSAGVALLAPVLAGSGEAAVGAAELPEAQLVETQAGDSLAAIAAQNGVSLARLMALNPGVGPLGLDDGDTVRIR